MLCTFTRILATTRHWTFFSPQKALSCSFPIRRTNYFLPLSFYASGVILCKVLCFWELSRLQVSVTHFCHSLWFCALLPKNPVAGSCSGYSYLTRFCFAFHVFLFLGARAQTQGWQMPDRCPTVELYPLLPSALNTIILVFVPQYS